MTADDLTVAAFQRVLPTARVPDVPRKPVRPVYDAATDGNPFAWILKTAKVVRIQEQAANETQRIKLAIARRAAMPVLVDKGGAQ